MKHLQTSPDLCPFTAISSFNPADLETAEPPTTLWGVRASDIERYSRVAFPVLFFTFHLLYWTSLISMAGTHVEDLIPLKTR